MDKEILEGNKLIAEFMGWKYSKSGKTVRKSNESSPYRLKDIQYHSSWDWLMPVIEKIESAGLIVQIGHNSYCSIYGEFKEDAPWDGFHVSTDTDPIAGKVENKINGVWLCVVQFIQWYNSNQPQQ